jgi:polysaccharide pyruvyl transferase WcaK-like protein
MGHAIQRRIVSVFSDRLSRFLPGAGITAPAGPAAGQHAGASQPSGRPAPRIAIFGGFGWGNLGNDGSLESLLGSIRAARPDAEIHCICHGQEIVGRTFGLPTLPILPAFDAPKPVRILNRLLFGAPNRLRAFLGMVRIARQFDLIAVAGTGILDDFGERWKDMPFHLFQWTLACRLAGTPFAFVSIGAGPIVHPVSRFLMKTAARLAAYRSYRDDFSKRYMAGIGLSRPGDIVTPDLAFRLPRTGGVSGPEVGRPIIGVGVMGYKGWKHAQEDGPQIYDGYIAKIAEFTDCLIDRGYAVRLIVGDDGDIDAVKDVRAALAGRPEREAFIIAEPAGSLSDVMRQMVGTEAVIATRFHNIVCALMMHKPVISIGYAKKNDELLAEAGLGAFCQHIERLDVELLKGQFDRLMRDKAIHIPKIEAMTGRYAGQLAAQEKQIFAKWL